VKKFFRLLLVLLTLASAVPTIAVADGGPNGCTGGCKPLN
jgi:hypothetical protein